MSVSHTQQSGKQHSELTRRGNEHLSTIKNESVNTNAKLDLANTTLASILVDTDAADSSLNTIEAQSVLTASRLNNIQNKISENTDGTGNTLGQLQVLTNTKLDTIATNTANIKISTDSVNLNVDTLETLQTATNTKLTEIDAVLDTIKTDSAAIKTAVELLDNAVSGNELQVDIVSSALASGGATSANQTTLIGHVDQVEGKLDTLETTLTAIETDQAALEVLHTATNSKLDTIDSVLDTIKADSAAIKTAVELIDNAVSGSELQVDVVSAPTTTVTGTVTANLSATDNAVLDDIAQKVGDVETSVQLIDDIVKAEDTAHSSGDKGVMFLGVRQSSQADFGADGDFVPISINDDGEIRVTSSGGSGGATEAKQDVIEATLTAIETDQAALEVLHTATNSKLDTIDGVLDNILVDTSAIKVDAAALEVLQTSTNSKLDHLSDNLDTLETTLTAIETDQAAIEVLLTGIDADTDACKTSLAALDNAVDGNYLNVNLNVAGSDVDANSGNKSAASQRVVIATDDVNMSAIKTATEASATDLAALEVLVTSTNSKLDTLETTLTAIETDQAALEVLHTSTNSKIDTLDSVLDTIKVDTEAIETAVEAIQALEQLTTTLIIDGQTVSSGGGTHTSSSVEVTKIPPSGKLSFLLRISGVSPADIGVTVQLSADDTNFFGADLSAITQGVATSGVGQFITCNFVSKHIKVQLTNTNGSSTATCTLHMFS